MLSYNRSSATKPSSHLCWRDFHLILIDIAIHLASLSYRFNRLGVVS